MILSHSKERHYISSLYEREKERNVQLLEGEKPEMPTLSIT